MTVASKKIIASYYDSGPKYSYWNGCSAGGRQAMKAAQRFPGDFDGIIAGAPGLDWTGRAASALRIAKPLEANEAARLTQAQRQMLHTAVVNACDLHDGVNDGVIENPKSCTFDPGVLECKGALDGSCLTKAQVETVRSILRLSSQPRTKRESRSRAWQRFGWTDLDGRVGAGDRPDQFRYPVFTTRTGPCSSSISIHMSGPRKWTTTPSTHSIRT
jgi:feruloyl esterase